MEELFTLLEDERPSVRLSDLDIEAIESVGNMFYIPNVAGRNWLVGCDAPHLCNMYAVSIEAPMTMNGKPLDFCMLRDLNDYEAWSVEQVFGLAENLPRALDHIMSKRYPHDEKRYLTDDELKVVTEAKVFDLLKFKPGTKRTQAALSALYLTSLVMAPLSVLDVESTGDRTMVSFSWDKHDEAPTIWAKEMTDGTIKLAIIMPMRSREVIE